jgi:hypothetical protein
MRRRSLKAIACTAVVALVGSVACATGCSANKPTELVPGALSQVQVPRDLQTIELDVTAEGATKFCEYVSVYDGQVELPRTLGVVSGESPNTIVTVTIRGYTGASATIGSGNCPDSLSVNDPSGNGPVVLRRSVQTFVGGHTLFLPMPLSFSCFSTDCSGTGPLDETSCAASRCVDLSKQDPVANAGKLVDFTPSLVDGTDVCFDPSRCFSDGLPAAPVAAGGGNDASVGPSDATTMASDCTYTFGNPALEQLPGINVRVFYQDYTWKQNDAGKYVTVVSNGGEEEILNEDPDEGFVVSSDGKEFTLAPGLCDLVKNATTPPPAPSTGTPTYHTISEIEAASGCQPKPPLLPFCAGQQNVPTTLADGGGLVPNLPDGGTTTDGKCNVAFPLTPAPSAMYMVMDDSAVMHAAFGMQGYATALGLSLSDPIFKQTSAAFTYLPHLDSECSGLDPDGGLATAFTNPQLGFNLAAQAQPAIANKLMAWMAPGDTVANPLNLDLGAAMRLDTGAYAEVASYVNQVNEIPAVAAAMFFLNRVPVPTSGPGSPASDAGVGNDCPFVPPATTEMQSLESKALAAYQAKPSMQTFFVVLDDDAHDGPTVALPFYQQMQTDVPQAVTVIDATSQQAPTVLANFESVVETLGTCLYELPDGVTNPEQIDVSYQEPPPPGSPVGLPAVDVPVDTGCGAATQNTANGWNIDENGRIRICGQPCTDLRNAILATSALALQAGQTVPPDVPVSAFQRCGVDADAAEPLPLEDAATLFPPVPEAGVDAGTSSEAGTALDASADAAAEGGVNVRDGSASSTDAAANASDASSADAGDGGP